MKSNQKKTWTLVVSLVLIVAVAVGVTLAYLTDREEVKNTFTVGKVDIVLDEADVNEDGSIIDGAERVKENDYHLIPGQTYVKDPTITVVKESEESYIRTMVTITNYSKMKKAFGDDFLPQNYLNGTWDDEKWIYTATTEDTTADTITYEFRYFETVSTIDAAEDLKLEPLFSEFTLPGTVTGENLAEIADGFDINVVGHAIQVATFENADEAWAAFDEQVK